GRILGTCQPDVVDLDALERAADEHRLEPAADGFDLGQLGHRPSLATAVGGYAGGADERTSSRIDRSCGSSAPMSYSTRSSRTASAADASSRACTSASTSPAPTSSPRFRRQTIPTEWSIASSFVRRPAPR